MQISAKTSDLNRIWSSRLDYPQSTRYKKFWIRWKIYLIFDISYLQMPYGLQDFETSPSLIHIRNPPPLFITYKRLKDLYNIHK